MNKNETSFLEVTPPARPESALSPDASGWPEWRRYWAKYRVSSRKKFPEFFLNRQTANPEQKNDLADKVAILLLDGDIATDHPELKGRVTSIFSSNTEERMATVDHATAMASIAIGKKTGFASQNVHLYSAAVVSANKKKFENNLERAVEFFPDLIKKYNGRCVVVGTFLAEPSQFIDRKTEQLLAHSAPVVWAAGNKGGKLGDFSPTRIPELITVGASALSDCLVWEEQLRTHYAKNLTIFAPGKYIYSAWASPDKNYNLCSGTSPAAMIVATVLARKIQAGEKADHQHMKNLIIEESTKDILILPAGIEAPNRLIYCEQVNVPQESINSLELYA